jgi:pimeloyl-ACP methyl ester carboxylesterase
VRAPPLWPGPLLGELRALRAEPVDAPPGDGRRVLLVGGMGSPGVALRPMRDWLRAAGWRVRVADVGRGIDCGERTAARLDAQLAPGDTLIAHSRGGQFARVVAVRRPGDVAALVTLGTPFEHFALARVVQLQAASFGILGTLGVPGLAGLGCLRGACCARFRNDLAAPWPGGVPFTSVYSRDDRTVRWETCSDPAARNVEIAGTHVGMLASRAAYAEIAAALGRV